MAPRADQLSRHNAVLHVKLVSPIQSVAKVLFVVVSHTNYLGNMAVLEMASAPAEFPQIVESIVYGLPVVLTFRSVQDVVIIAGILGEASHL
jgi:hypothetical protein